MTKKELIKRYIFFTIGLFVNALGVSFITKAQLGTSPISSVPFTLSTGFPLSMGAFTFLLNMVLIIGQIVLLRKNFNKIQFVQIPVSVAFGVFIDMTMSMLSIVNPSNYGFKLIYLIIGCIILGLGVGMEVIANAVMLSGEAFVNAVCTKFKRDFGTTKIQFDISLVVISSIVSLILFRKVVGAREGTLIAALTVGLIARFFYKTLAFIDTKILSENVDAEEEELEEVS